MSMSRIPMDSVGSSLSSIDSTVESLKKQTELYWRIMDLFILGHMPASRYVSLRKLMDSNDEENRNLAIKTVTELHKKHYA